MGKFYGSSEIDREVRTRSKFGRWKIIRDSPNLVAPLCSALVPSPKLGLTDIEIFQTYTICRSFPSGSRWYFHVATLVEGPDSTQTPKYVEAVLRQSGSGVQQNQSATQTSSISGLFGSISGPSQDV